ncbi:target of Nesh-SH3 isoform X3 [Synchiropus splendidus]|uniref:target of Nesh-SH3 isoform X3 n=1 Tax=Synchiropus splendidus TaxID=270530 RepID=UPI00237EAEBE|nr:target of Nesh-SH3 isoform X3 [Synchiropus splendidus]
MRCGTRQKTLAALVLLLVFIAGMGLCGPSASQRSRVRRQNMKVRINATGDTIVMKFLRPNSDTKLEGYILGYGSSMFSKQFIQLPENGKPYETEFDAEPKYLIAVQPIPTNDVKKHCKGKVQLDKPLHLVIGSVTPTSVLLSWGTLLKTPYESNIMNDCLEDGHYTVRYRERNRKWNYQTCPTSETVIDHLKPNTVYEFGVQPNSKDGTGVWSKPVVHVNRNREKVIRPTVKSRAGSGKHMPGPHFDPRTGTGPSVVEDARSSTSSAANPAGRNATLFRDRVPPDSTRNGGRSIPPSKTLTPSPSSNTPKAGGAQHRGIARPKPVVWSKDQLVLHPSVPVKPVKRPNLVGIPNEHDKPMDLKQGDKMSFSKPLVSRQQTTTPALKSLKMDLKKADKAAILKPLPPLPKRQTTNATPAVNSFSDITFNATRFDKNENSSIFSSQPTSDVDAMGRKRYTADHVVYKTDKKPNEPCSITSSLAYFPDEEGVDRNVTNPPSVAPSNLTVVTVEGCPSFVILDWEKSDNETKEYEVVSTTKGPNGQEVSILTTNQTHTAVENLKPESSYEFKVTPKNELGTGPSSDLVSFSTESADPRVSENVSGKDAIWTQFPFKADSYSECNGKMYVKRTWYRKFVGIQLCNSLRYKIYLSDSLNGKFYNIGDQTGYGEDHCQFVDSFLDGRTGTQMFADQLPSRPGFYRALRQEPVHFGEIGAKTHVTYVGWYECGTPIPGKW